MSNFTQLSEGDGTIFLVRWRGRQEGPYTGPVMAAKLAANEIGLLHEVYYESQWITIRDYIAAREAARNAELQAREKAEQLSRVEGEKQAREREAQLRAEALAEERRKSDLLAAGLARQNNPDLAPAFRPTALRPHRGGLILTLGVVGFFICGLLGLAAWIMGGGDLREMDAGRMDDSGRTHTNSGRIIGMLATILWMAGAVFYFIYK